MADSRIVQVNIEDHMKAAYIDYSMSVIVSRALPDVRDGLKPVHRRVLFGMNEMGMSYNKAHKKSAFSNASHVTRFALQPKNGRNTFPATFTARFRPSIVLPKVSSSTSMHTGPR